MIDMSPRRFPVLRHPCLPGIDLFEHEEAGYMTEEPKEEKIEEVELLERRVPKPLSDDEYYELNRGSLVPRPGSIDMGDGRRSSDA
jgi:hypothetical protein